MCSVSSVPLTDKKFPPDMIRNLQTQILSVESLCNQNGLQLIQRIISFVISVLCRDLYYVSVLKLALHPQGGATVPAIQS